MQDPESLKQFIADVGRMMHEELSLVLPSNWDVPETLRASMMYSLLAGGKRLRPVFVLAATEAIGHDHKDAISIASAIELIHTYSLIHDDLPAMDNDDFRRGKPTNHRMFGEAMAILAGDALLTHAFYLVSTTPDRCPNVSPATALAITKELSIFAGAMGMVGGQAADILSVQGETDLERLDYIHTHKTADLIVFSLRAGGLIGGARPQQLQALEIFGQSIGLAFQIQDDILDIIGDQHKLGKKTKSDETQNKVTYPYLMGLDQSIQKVEQLTRLGKEALLDGAIPQPQRLLLLAEYLMSRDF